MNKQPMADGTRDTAVSAQAKKQHTLILHGRKRLELSGVLDVLRFDEGEAEFSTTLGDLAIDGRGLRIEAFDTERGAVLLTGEVEAMTYLSPEDAPTKKKSGRLFGGR